MLKLLFSRSISLSWRWLPVNFQWKYLLRKSYHIKALDIFQFHRVHELFYVAVLANRRVCPIAIECIKPLVLIAQLPKVVDIHGHSSLTGM